MKQTLLKIAQRNFGVTTLEPSHRDGNDFHEISVWAMQRALSEAYEAGLNAAKERKR